MANSTGKCELFIALNNHNLLSLARRFNGQKFRNVQKLQNAKENKVDQPTEMPADQIIYCRHMHTYIQFNPYLLERELVFTVCTIMKVNDIGCSSFARHHHLFGPNSCILQDEMKFIYDTRLFGIIFYVLTGNMVVPGLYVNLSVSISSFLSIFLWFFFRFAHFSLLFLVLFTRASFFLSFNLFENMLQF